MKKHILLALFALISFLPARAQIAFSDSVQISLLTCSPGPDAYERFGHSGLRVHDLRNPELDLTFDFGVFSFTAPNFIYRFVKGETDYQLGARYTSDFIDNHRRRGLGMVEQRLRLDSAQCQNMISRLLINYRPENRIYRYNFFFDNCATRPFQLINQVTNYTIQYDSVRTKAITLRQMVQEKTGLDNWLDFGIALAVAIRADQPATYMEQMFLPDYLKKAMEHAQIPMQMGENKWMTSMVEQEITQLEMQPQIAEAIAARDLLEPNTVFAILLLIALLISGMEFRNKHINSLGKAFDCIVFLATGLTGCIVWFLNFLSLHPAVDHNINCLWLLPTHVIMAGLLWVKKLDKACRIYFGITFAGIIVYVICDWLNGQYCPNAFLLILATLLLRCFMHFSLSKKRE